MRGRKPAGPAYVRQLVGSGPAKERLEVILQTLAGGLSLREACARLGVGPTRLHVLRQAVLQAALACLEPQPVGRPRRPSPPADVTTLEDRVADLEVELRTARVREEVALILPQVAAAAGPAGKKTRRRPRTRRRRST